MDVEVTRDGAIATMWLNRPAKRNAITIDMWQAIAEHCSVLADDAAVRVLVVRGTGDHFCAGADIGALGTGDDDDDGARLAANRAASVALATFPKPTIAFVAGSCVGGGAELAIACDLRIADTTSRFGITPARLGLLYPSFALERAVHLIGVSAAKHLLFSAELIDAEWALRIGLVDEVHEPASASARLTLLTALLAERSLLTQCGSKEMVESIVEHGRVTDDIESRWRGEAALSTDRAEGVAAFLERREPRFTWSGRREDG
ncbi:MAG: enoyl-CoA hydratase/isomerase family protein [Ilumatobacteraceae bacterium]